MLAVRSVSKSYGEHAVLDKLSLNIEKGKVTSFVGANGAGKSTLLSIMARLLRATEGEVLLDGEPIHNIKDLEMAKRISILKQSNNLSIRLTIRDLVSLGRFPHSRGRLKPEDIHAVNRSINYLDLVDIQHKYLDQVSGGQRQRAFIAMVVAQETDYVLLDEPLNNLDIKNSVQIMKTLRRLVDEMGKTVVLVIHDINFASAYSDNIVAMKDGRIVRSGCACEMIEAANLKEIFDIECDVFDAGECKLCNYFL